MAIKDILKEVEAKFEEVIAEVEAKVEPVAQAVEATVAPVEAKVETAVTTSPIIAMAIAQAAERKAKDLAHGFK
jgi:hypothetical protein